MPILPQWSFMPYHHSFVHQTQVMLELPESWSVIHSPRIAALSPSMAESSPSCIASFYSIRARNLGQSQTESRHPEWCRASLNMACASSHMDQRRITGNKYNGIRDVFRRHTSCRTPGRGKAMCPHRQAALPSHIRHDNHRKPIISISGRFDSQDSFCFFVARAVLKRHAQKGIQQRNPLVHPDK